jgi:branched-chain amino acid transport system substrate-binding protein
MKSRLQRRIKKLKERKMKNRIKGGIQIAVLLLGLAALLLLSACVPTVPVEEEKVVEIGLIAELTGPAGTASQYVFWGLGNYVNYFNEKEGIPGVTLKTVWQDTGRGGYALVLSGYRRFVERGVPAFINVSLVAATGLKSLAERDQTPYITLALSEDTLYPPGWAYSIYPTESERFSVWCDWIMENWEEERSPRVALMSMDTPWGRQLEDGGTKYAEGIGIEMLPVEIIPYVPLDVTPQLLRLRDRGADFAYITGLWTTATPILKDAERLGLTGQIQFAGYENSQSIALLEALGPAAEGYSSARVAPWVEEVEVPGIELVRDLWMKYPGRPPMQGDEAHPFRAAYVGCEAIKRAIEEVGYENLDGAAVARALDGIEDFDPYGIGPITYTPEDRRGSNLVRIYQVQGREVVPVADWRETPMLVPH